MRWPYGGKLPETKIEYFELCPSPLSVILVGCNIVTLSDKDIETLLDLRSESPNLDYKKGLVWNGKDKKDERLEIIKDIIAMANTKDGGKIIFGVADPTFDFEGLSKKQFESFDLTDLANLLHEYADPKTSCQIYKKKIHGKLTVIIDIPEFPDTPIICKKDAHSQNNPSKQILKKGGIYIRTARCSSEVIPSAQEMRELLGRALIRKGDELLRSIERLIKGRPGEITESDKEIYHKEVEEGKEFLEKKLGASLGDNGYWELVAHPVGYKPDRISDMAMIGKIISEAQVSLRGWYFPHIQKENVSNFDEGKQSITIWTRYIEGWRIYRSGLFIWRDAFWEDVEGHKEDGKSVLSFVDVIYSLTEFTLFLKRLYADALNVDDVYLSIRLNRCKDRKLFALDLSTTFSPGFHISREDFIHIQETLKVVELQAEHKEIAAKYVKKVFRIFNWEDVADEVIAGWQNKLLERRG